MLKIALPLFFTALLMADGPVLKTGQTTVYKTGDDGTYQTGIARSYTRDDVNGIVTDNATGLEWQDDYSDNGNNVKIAAWAAAAPYCAGLGLDGGGWRLPTQYELRTLVDYSRQNPAIDPTFKKTEVNHYWSSTTSVPNSSFEWGVFFGDGNYEGLPKSGSYYVRCVRGGQ